jgi:hypothetical protein
VPESVRGVGEDVALAAVHEVSFHGIAVVVAGEVEGAVRGQQIEFESQWHAEAARLSSGGVGGDDQLTDERPGIRRLERKREYIGAPADAAVSRVEASDLVIIDHCDLDETRRAPDRGQRPVDGTRQA